jgi:anti-sigma factor RsiW
MNLGKQQSDGSASGPFTYYRAPATLRRRIRAAISRAESPRPAWWRNLGWMGPAIGFACASLMTANVLILASIPSKQERLAEDVLGSHLRALMTERAIDVESSEQHTVKPWYTGKLDFSPPVTDFAREGFALAGGRVDYVDGRTVAALVYRHRRHVIDVFVWPAQGTGAAQVLQRRGYNIVHWKRDGLAYWVASDVEAGELRRLETLIESAGAM